MAMAAQEPSPALGTVLNRAERTTERDRELRTYYGSERRSAYTKKESPLSYEEAKDSRPTGELSFRVNEIKVTPSSYVSPKEIEKAIHFKGPGAYTVTDLNDMVDGINALYQEKGIMTAKAVLPPQKVVGGIVYIRIIEGKYGKTTVRGNHRITDSYIKHRIHTATGSLVDLKDLEESIERYNGSNRYAIRASVTPGEQEGTSDVELILEEPENPWNTILFVDNSGQVESGRYRLGSYSEYRGIGGGDAGFYIAPTWTEGIWGGSIGLDTPIGRSGTRMSLSYSRNIVHIIDGVFSDFNLKSKSNDLGLTVSHLSAYASTTGDIGSGNEKRTEAELEAKIEKAGEENVALGLLKDVGGNLRAVATATKIKAEADVDIENSDLYALGSTEKEGTHGNLSVLSDARSKLSTITLGGVHYGVNVGISDVSSHVNIEGSHLSAKKDATIEVKGNNNVSLNMIELGFLADEARSSVNFSWAEVNSDVKAQVGKGATILSGEDAAVKAESVRTLSSSASNGGTGDIIGVAVSVALADTKVEATMDGKIYAGGDVAVKAKNTVDTSDGGIYAADTTKASTMSGDSALAPTVNPVKEKVLSLLGRMKKSIKGAGEKAEISSAKKDLSSGEEAKTPEEEQVNAKPWNKLGINAATAVLISRNDAKAAVTGKVRGIKDLPKEGQREGSLPFVADDTAGAKSLSVKAENISRATGRTLAFQNRPPEDSDLDRKSTTVSAGVPIWSLRTMQWPISQAIRRRRERRRSQQKQRFLGRRNMPARVRQIIS